jgi:MFS family permease
MIWVGWVTCVGSLVAASFSTTVWQLIISQGLGYGIGFLILYYAMLDMLNEWFVERRGLAYGVLFAAAGLSGTGLPFLTETLLSKFGYAWTLRIYAVSMLAIIGPTLPFCRGRLPTTSHQARMQHKIAYGKIFKNPIFYFFTLSNLFQGLAFYLPGIYLSLYAWSLSIGTFPSILLLCLLNLAQVVGQVASGYLSDTSSIFVLLMISTLGSALTCLLWYFATNITLLAIFAGLYGIFAGGYSVFFSRFVSALSHDASTSLWLYGIFAFQRGLGNVAAGPLSALLLQKMVHQPVSDMPAMNVPMTMAMGNSSMVEIMQQNQLALSLGFRKLIIFVGGGLLLATFGGIGIFFRQHILAPLGSPKDDEVEMILTKEPISPDPSLYSSPKKRRTIWIKDKSMSTVTERDAFSSWTHKESDWT